MKNEIDLFCLDPGTDQSGVAIIERGAPSLGKIMINGPGADAIFAEIAAWHTNALPESIVIIEDVGGYATRVGDETFDTVRIIAVLCYRLGLAGIPYVLVKRWMVKDWIFKAFQDVVLPRIKKKIDYAIVKRKREEDAAGTEHKEYKGKPSMIYVDDRIVLACMQKFWDIKKPKPGKVNPIGLKDHSWQALAAGTWYLLNG